MYVVQIRIYGQLLTYDADEPQLNLDVELSSVVVRTRIADATQFSSTAQPG